jgi:hypothetical protein
MFRPVNLVWFGLLSYCPTHVVGRRRALVPFPLEA